MTSIFIGNDYDGIMLLHKAFQRAGGWCEPVPMEEKQSHSRVDSAKNESIRVVEYGCPVIGFGLHWSPRVTDCRETSVSKVVPRIVYSSLRLLSFKDFFLHRTSCCIKRSERIVYTYYVKKEEEQHGPN